MDLCRNSTESTLKRTKHQILKGADHERVIKNTYDKARDYIYIWDKRIQIQKRALACQSKTMTHMPHRELHVMGCAGLMRQDAEMTNLHPDLGETRRQELRNFAFLPSPLFYSQLVQEGEEFLLKRAPLNHKIKLSDPTKIGPFLAPREAGDITRNAPMDNLPLVVQPLQTEAVSVAEVAGASSEPIAG